MLTRFLLCGLLSANPLAMMQGHAQPLVPSNHATGGPQIPQQQPRLSHFQLHSHYTQQDYFIQVAQPSSAAPAQGYAVLYVLDGNASFDAARAVAASLGQGSARMGLEPTLVVSIGYPDTALFQVDARAKDYTPKPEHPIERRPTREYGGADQFARFIEQELKPKIQHDFHINPQQQSLYGHSFGGLFVLDQFLRQQLNFQRYIAASPSLWFDQYALNNTLQQWLKTTPSPTSSAMLMITYGSRELRQDQDNAEKQQHEKQIIAQLQQQPAERLHFWSFVHPQEQHISNLYASLPKALYLAACKDLNSCQNIFGPTNLPSPIYE